MGLRGIYTCAVFHTADVLYEQNGNGTLYFLHKYR